MTTSPAATTLGPVKRDSAFSTRTPSAAKRSAESFGAIASITPRTCSRTRAMLTWGSLRPIPKRAPSRMPWASSPAAISAFDGTQPTLRQSPPMRSRSMRTTGTPNEAAIAATDKPPAPAPITQRSGFSTSLKGERSAESSSVRMLGRRRRGLRHRRVRRPAAPVAHDDRDQRHDAERREGGENLRRKDRPKVEIEGAIRPSRVLAGVERRLLGCDHAVEPCPGRREGEGRRQDADHGREGEGLGPDAEKRRREVRTIVSRLKIRWAPVANTTTMARPSAPSGRYRVQE